MPILQTSILKKIYFVLLCLGAIAVCSYRIKFGYVTGIVILFWVGLCSLFWAIFGRITTGIIIANAITIILYGINIIKVFYYKQRLFFPDFILAFDRQNFDTLFQYPLLLISLICFISFFIFNIYLYRNSKKSSLYTRIGVFFIFLISIYGNYLITTNKSFNEDWQQVLPAGRGVITNLVMSAKGAIYTPPYYATGDKYFLEKAMEVQLVKNKNPIKPNILIFLQESTFNPNLFEIGNASFPNLQMFNPNAVGLKAHNLLRVQAYGGGTWLSEFTMATGLDTSDFGIRQLSVFYTVAPHIQTSLYKELVNNGYYTILLTPMNKNNYNTQNAYKNFGIDLVLQPQDLGYPAGMNENLWKVTSQEMLDYAKDILNDYSKKENKPIALFMLSMAEHGPYDNASSDQLSLKNSQKDNPRIGAMNDYYKRLVNLDKATEDFTQYVLNSDRPLLFLYFGDHQPALEYYDYKVKYSEPIRLTQFFMKDNLPYPPLLQQHPIMDISFVGGLILDYLGLSVSPFYEANIKMRYLCGGLLRDCPDQKLVESYKHYIYQTIEAAGKQSK